MKFGNAPKNGVYRRQISIMLKCAPSKHCAQAGTEIWNSNFELFLPRNNTTSHKNESIRYKAGDKILMCRLSGVRHTHNGTLLCVCACCSLRRISIGRQMTVSRESLGFRALRRVSATETKNRIAATVAGRSFDEIHFPVRLRSECISCDLRRVKVNLTIVNQVFSTNS